MEFLQLCLKGLEVADGLLKDRVWAQGLQLHEVTADVVKTHVSEATSVISWYPAGVFYIS